MRRKLMSVLFCALTLLGILLVSGCATSQGTAPGGAVGSTQPTTSDLILMGGS